MSLNILLNEIKNIVNKYKLEKRNQLKEGKSFNIFKILNASYKENLHSKFIGELLDPNGSHGQGYLFLNLFLEHINPVLPNFKFNASSANIYLEYNIGSINNSQKQGGRIDLLIKDNEKRLIIIENKIKAKDQPKQLERYYNFAASNSKKNNFIILYLTPDGHHPSQESTEKLKKQDYLCISYKKHIIPWLEKCIEATKNKHQLNEVLNQYLQTIKSEILYIMENWLQEKIYTQATTSNETLEAALSIINSNLKNHIREKFINSLEEKATIYGFITKFVGDGKYWRGLKFQQETYKTDFINYEKNNRWILFIDEKKSRRFAMYIGWDNRSNGVYFGISATNNQIKITGEIQKICKKIHFWSDPNDDTDQRYSAYGYSYFYNTAGKNLHLWDNDDALLAMNDGSLIKYIDEKLFKPSIEKKLIENLEKYTSTRTKK